MRQRILVALLAGLAVGTFLEPFASSAMPRAKAPTTLVFDTSSCPPGRYDVDGVATDPNGLRYPLKFADVALPGASGTLPFTWSDLPPTTYRVTATAKDASGATWSAEAVSGMPGLGTAPVPQPSPSPTPTVTPTPSPTATPSPTPSAWTLSSPATGATISGVVTVTAPNPQPGSTAGFKVELRTMAGALARQSGTYTAQATDTVFSIQIDVSNVTPGAYVLRGLFSVSVSADLPVTVAAVGSPQPTPSPTPTTSPSPTPSPAPIVDLTPVVSAVTAGNAAILNAIAAGFASLSPPPISTVACTVQSMGSYANGDQKPTLRCPPSGFAIGMTIKVIK